MISFIMKWIKKIFLTPLNSIYIVMFLRTVALILIISLIYFIIENWKDNISLIGALGILISALLASYTVIMNIENTKRSETEKKIHDKHTNIFFLLQNLIDIGASLNAYKGMDIGDMKINSHRKLKYILEKKLTNIEDKEILKSLSDEESNYLTLLRLRLYESIAILDNYTQGIVNDNPALINENIQEMIEIYEKFIWELSENHNIKIHQRSNKT